MLVQFEIGSVRHCILSACSVVDKIMFLFPREHCARVSTRKNILGMDCHRCAEGQDSSSHHTRTPSPSW
jgi:hypothetical protein